MHGTRRGIGLGLAATAVMAVSACSWFGPSPAEQRAAAVSSARNAAPGTYGSPVDPSLPNPTHVATDPPVTTAPSGATTVFVTRSGWNNVAGDAEMAGYVSGLVESHGTCTLTLTMDGRSVTATVDATRSATSMACAGLAIPRAQVSPGTWAATLTYKSDAVTATSKAAQVVVP